MIDLVVCSPDMIEGKVEARLFIANELTGGVISGGVDEDKALNYEEKRKWREHIENWSMVATCLLESWDLYPKSKS